jgi:hypothetical protein
MDSHVVIYSARSRYWARVFEAALRLEGIEVELVDADAAARRGRPVDVVVDRGDVERARALAEDFERYQVSVGGDGPSVRELGDSGRGTGDGDVEIDQAALVDLLETVRIEAGDWPACPNCERPRLAVCPFCETSSNEMPQGDPRYGGQSLTELLANEHGEASNCGAERTSPPLLICPTCDEPFEARYLRRCEWCGHDFGAGLEVPPAISVTPININARAVALTLALVVGMVLLVMYFSYL